jgi:serine/threonine-protein kinase
MPADPRLVDLLLRYEEMRERGQPAAPEELCRDCPELLDGLRRELAELGRLDARLGVTPPGPDTGPSGPDVPGYEILGELGRGGMGVVYQARQVSLNRLVALKVVLAGEHAAPSELARFRREAEALARLHHPHILQVYEVGEHRGRPFFAMEYLGGGSLAAWLAGRQAPLRQAAELVETLARAVQAAHECGIVHRDLKPANVLLSGAGPGARGDSSVRETINQNSPPATVPKISDFGLAKQLGGAGPTPSNGAVLGTPSYMAPEQAQGKSKQVGPASDVYGLGAILYELLTGRPPFQGETGLDVLLQVISREPVPPSVLRPRLPRDLEIICVKCLQKAPNKRYASALALADDLHRFREGRPITARPVGAVERAAKWVRRRPAVAALWAVGVAAVLLGGGGALWWQGVQASRRAETERAVGLAVGKAEQLREEARKVPATQPEGAAQALALWQQALAAADEAQGIMAAGLAGPETARRAAHLRAELRAGVEQAELALHQVHKDARLLRELDQARLARSTLQGQSFHRAASAERYRIALARYGLDVFGQEPAAVARRLRRLPRRVREPLLIALDDWGFYEPRAAVRRRLRRIADGAHGDPWRRRLRRARDPAALKGLAAEAHKRLTAETWDQAPPAASLELLGTALSEVVTRAEAVRLLRRAQQRYPDDFWINYMLAFDLAEGLPHENPDQASRQRWGEVVSYLRAAVALRPDNAAARNSLGLALVARGDIAGAVIEFRRTIALEPTYAKAYYHLGNVLKSAGDLPGAIAAYRRAAALDPGDPKAHYNLAAALRARGDIPGAVAACRRALAIDPKYAQAHNGLGLALQARGDLDGAVAAYRRAIALDPKDPMPHGNLGFILESRGDLKGAVTEYRKTIALAPRLALAHSCLGRALLAQGDAQGAARAFQKAVLYNPHDASAHCNLGFALRQDGRLKESLHAMRRGHREGASQPGWRQPSAQWVREAERLAELDKQLPDFLQGKRQPQSAGEMLDLAGVCRLKKRFAAAARFYQEAFAQDPKQEAPNRYSAACCAALAGSGRREDAAPLGDKDKARLRGRALQWLRADLARWARQLGGVNTPDRQAVLRALQHWQQDADLGGVRDMALLAQLPKAERREWAKFWGEVAGLVARAGPGK